MSRSGNSLSEQVRGLGWFQFQNLIAGALAKRGYGVESFPRSIATSTGIDLVLRRSEGRLAVRCSHGDSWRVGLRILRQFAMSRTVANIPEGLFVSASGFTDEVYDHAASYRIIPWDVPEIVHLLDETHATRDPILKAWLLDDREWCPYCEEAVGSRSALPVPRDRTRCLACPRVQTCAYTLGIWAEYARKRRSARSWSPIGPVPPTWLAPYGEGEPASMEMLIGPRDCSRSRDRFEPTHLVSLLDPGTDITELRPPWIAAENHHVEFFQDVRDPSSPYAPREGSIRSVIEWLKPRCRPGTRHRFVIHGHAGIGRSPAVGYVAWAIHLGPGREQEAWNRMIHASLKKAIAPNSLVVGLADAILGRRGALCTPVNRWSLPIPWNRIA